MSQVVRIRRKPNTGPRFSGFRAILPLWVGITVTSLLTLMLVYFHGTEKCLTQVANLLSGRDYELYAWIVVMCYFVLLFTSVWSLIRIISQTWVIWKWHHTDPR